ncbi:50S ribosomal L10 domain protein [Mycobacterium xenopi 3993]|nr:50S ribosomal L10 domain protein [Mycobacterium xenopi 3993]
MAKNTLVKRPLRRRASRGSTNCSSDRPRSPSSPVSRSTPQGHQDLRQGAQGAGHQGWLHGRHPLTVAEVERIADLESREVLLAKLAGAMKGNLAKAAGLFNAPPRKWPACRSAAGQETGRAAAAPDPGRITPPSPHQGRTHTMAKLSTDELLDAFKEMTLLELSDFVKKFEETFEVTAAPGRGGSAAPGAHRPPRRRLVKSRPSSTSSWSRPETRRSA